MQDAYTEFKNTPAAFKMIFVEGGIFEMGGNDENARQDEKPVHKVKLSSFWMGEIPVTQAVWAWVMKGTDKENPSEFKGDRHPVECVSWEDIVNYFLPRLNKITNCPADRKYRLPTEAEWEYAAKGGVYNYKYAFQYAGSNKMDELGWYSENSHRETKQVGLKTSNLLGLYDMSGNVYEWCSDWRSINFLQDYDTPIVDNPTGPNTGWERVYRGGAWVRDKWNCRCAYRGDQGPEYRLPHAGFRLVLS
jgi:formylglycine-generating enzyme